MRLICLTFVAACLLHADEAADSLFTAGIADAKAGHLEQAAATLNKGRLAYPKDPRFPIELAGVAFRQQHVKSAERWLLRGLKLAPKDAYGNDFLGTLYQMDGNLAASLKYWNRVDAPFLTGVTFRSEAGLAPDYRARLFLFSGGQIFTVARLQTTEANLLRSNVVASVRINVRELPNKRYEAIADIQPKAGPLTGWPGRLLPLIRDLPYEGVDLDFYNLHGRGDNFISLWRWDPDKRRIHLEWQSPVRGNPRSEYLAWVDGREELWDLRRSYAGGTNGLPVRSLGIGAGYITGLTAKLQWSLGGSATRHVFGGWDGNSLLRNAWTATINNRVDYLLWSVPEHRLSTSVWALFDAGRVWGNGNPSRLIITRIGLNSEWLPQRSGDKYRLTSQVQAGRLFGNAPLDELFQLGMERDTEQDLWLRGVLSAANGRKGTGLIGREYAITQTTFARRFFHVPFVTFAAGPFFDVGWVSGDEPSLLHRDTTYSIGIQASIRTIAGLTLTIVYGRDLASGSGAFYTATSR